MAADAVTRNPRRENMSTSFAGMHGLDGGTILPNSNGACLRQHLHVFSGPEFDCVMNVVLPPFRKEEVCGLSVEKREIAVQRRLASYRRGVRQCVERAGGRRIGRRSEERRVG